MASLDSTLTFLTALADASRLRLLALLAREELSVAELVQVTELAQSRVSSHLAKLKEAGLVRDRREGASSYWALAEGALPEPAGRLWELVQQGVQDRVLDGDRERCEALLRARAGAASWPDALAGQLDRHYSPGRTWEATARGLLGFVTLGGVLDVGAGDGVTAALLAPRAESVTLLDKSERLLAAARERLAGVGNVSFVHGDMHELPFGARGFDAVVMFNTLTYAERPARALAEAARVLRSKGRLVVVTLARHDAATVTASYSHVNAGFEPAQLARWLGEAGLEVESCGVTSRERQRPHFEVVTAVAVRPREERNR